LLDDWAREWANTAPLGGCPIQTGLLLEQAGLQKLVEKDLALTAKRNTIMRNAIPVAKGLAITLDRAGSGSPHQHLARIYDVSKALVCKINYDVDFILCKEFVPSMIPL